MDCKEQCCGKCVHHRPNKDGNPSRLRLGAGKGQTAYWVCGITNTGKYHEDGKTCEKFDNRYDTDEKAMRWLCSINKNYTKFSRLSHLGG